MKGYTLTPVPCPPGSTEEENNMAMIRRQSKTIEEAIDKVEAGKHGKVGAIFKMREIIEGPKKKVQEPTAIKHPITGKLMVSGTEIKSATLEYCIETLQNNKPDAEYEKLIKLKKDIHDQRMKQTDGHVVLEKEDFEYVVERFKAKPTKTYDFLREGFKKKNH